MTFSQIQLWIALTIGQMYIYKFRLWRHKQSYLAIGV